MNETLKEFFYTLSWDIYYGSNLDLLASFVSILTWAWPIVLIAILVFCWKCISRKNTDVLKAKEEYKRKQIVELEMLLPIDYAAISQKEKIGSFEEEIVNHINAVYSDENENKYKDVIPYSNNWKNRKYELERLVKKLKTHTELSKYVNIAFQHFMNGRWNECNINLRKVIEWMAFTIVDAKEMMFEGNVPPSLRALLERIYNMDDVKPYRQITWDYNAFMEEDMGSYSYNNWEFNIKSAMLAIIADGNAAAHGFSNKERTIDFESCHCNFAALEQIVLWFFDDRRLENYFTREGKDLKSRFGIIEELIVNEYYDDAAINIRITLEMLVKKYFEKYRIICLYGHPKSLVGYIDILFEKEFVSEESKSNMHKIRGITNNSAHNENGGVRKGSVLMCYELLKKEIDVFEMSNRTTTIYLQ